MRIILRWFVVHWNAFSIRTNGMAASKEHQCFNSRQVLLLVSPCFRRFEFPSVNVGEKMTFWPFKWSLSGLRIQFLKNK